MPTKIEKIVARHLDLLRGREILDIACGNAVFTLGAAEYAKTTVGVDVSLERVKPEVLEGLPGNVSLMEMDASALEFPDESFDGVFAYNALGHLADAIGPCTREMIRVLRTGGEMCFFATWKMDRGILTCIGERTPGTGMSLLEAVECPEYTARIWRKNGPGSGEVWVVPR